MAELLVVSYCLSEKARQAEFVATGQMPPVERWVKFPLAEMSPEQRAIVIECLGIGHEWPDTSPYPRYRAHIDELHPRFEVKGGYSYQKPYLERHKTPTHLEVEPTLMEALDMLKALPEREAEARATLADELAQAQAEWEAKEQQAAMEKKAEQQWQRQREEREAQEKAAFEVDRAAWAEAHGSDHLKRAVAAGYTCTRMYLRERAAVEYPGFVVDLENVGEWKSRSCPSLKALDLIDALKAQHGENIVKAEIVWLTKPARDRKPAGYSEDAEEEWNEEQCWEPCEAVVVKDRHYRNYDLVREF